MERYKISYKKLRMLKTKHDIRTWKEFCSLTKINKSTATKLNDDEYVNLRTLAAVAYYFDCDIGDLVELVKEDGRGDS